jgi:hypothetical protein
VGDLKRAQVAGKLEAVLTYGGDRRSARERQHVIVGPKRAGVMDRVGVRGSINQG